jgi:DNA-binding NarL/FixJ family response regulator
MQGQSASGRYDGERRLRVLVADDNASILAKASTRLARDFEVVAAVSDGRQALHAARRLDPDVAVLDVTMPELDGFQTARQLKQSGSRARIVMMTMHDSDEFVATAIGSGAHGYVLKTRMQSDLASAIDHATAGRLFVPSLTSLLAIAPAPGPGRHAMLLATEPRLFLDDVSRLLAATLRRGDMAAIIATEATRDAVNERLLARGCDLVKATDRGTYVSFDAAVASDLVVSGRLDTTRVAAFISELERSRLAVSAPNLTVVGVGAIAPLLFAEGNHEAAIQLERTWDDLTRGLPFLTVCCYASATVEAGGSELFPQICNPHSAACHAHAAFGRVV